MAGKVDPLLGEFRQKDVGGGGGAVDSVNGQTGAVSLVASDIPVTPAGSIASTDVQDAIEELDAEKAPTVHTHAISDVIGLSAALDGKVDENASITGATKTKITFDSKGLVTAGSDAAIADITGLQSALDGKSAVGHTHVAANITDFSTEVDAIATPLVEGAIASHVGDADPHSQYQKESEKGSANGYAELDGSGKVPSAQLPSFVDDVLEFANLAGFPGTGASGVIYVALDTNLAYRWGGSSYVEISPSLALGETSTTAYRGDRGKTAYDHSQLTSGNPHNVTKTDVGLSNVDNTSDLSKPISTATQTALDGKSNVGHTHPASDITGSINDTQHGNRGGGALHAAATTSVAGFMSSSDKTKLDGVAAGATANDTDANLKNRANHTGTQTASTISDLQETVEDIIGTKVVAGANVTVTYNDTTGETTVAASGGGGGGGQAAITFKDQNSPLGSAGTVDAVSFDGDLVTAVRTGNQVDVTISNPGMDYNLLALIQPWLTAKFY